MRRLFFTAIAMVAFSSVSIANTIVDESTKKDSTTDTVSCTRRSTTTCADGTQITVSVTSTVPSTWDYNIDNMGAACSAALKKAKSLSAAGC